MLSPLFLLLSNSSFLVTLMQDLDETLSAWKKYCVNIRPENAKATAYYFFKPVPSIIFQPPTPYSGSLIETRHPDCAPAQITGISSTMSFWDGGIGWMLVTKAVRGVECWTDHHLIIWKLNIRDVRAKRATEHHETKRRSNQVIICCGLQWATWYHPFWRSRCGRRVDHSPGHRI